MSWLKTVAKRAVEVSREKRLGRTVHYYADTVVQHAGQAVAGGARILQNRIGNNNHTTFKYAVKRLEEAAVSCKERDRIELLKLWLISLKEVERICGASQESMGADSPQSVELPYSSPTVPKNYSLDLFFDSDQEGEPINFHEVFLQSQALEGMTMSMRLDAGVRLQERTRGVGEPFGSPVHFFVWSVPREESESEKESGRGSPLAKRWEASSSFLSQFRRARGGWRLLEVSKQQGKPSKLPKQQFGGLRVPWTAVSLFRNVLDSNGDFRSGLDSNLGAWIAAWTVLGAWIAHFLAFS
ncbi:hypothetical protein IEQ34_013575 [Dendrobium chrysotoxum]|uniref:Uncharacterized protein n=1 Tax=Dendrobium chrysotoxum TaxID=161865 RepID=A0AAV7GPU4_DENCH|nr:hypothetical protein IEQ34_013575 [Dendrobium chrysotoxum]